MIGVCSHEQMAMGVCYRGLSWHLEVTQQQRLPVQILGSSSEGGGSGERLRHMGIGKHGYHMKCARFCGGCAGCWFSHWPKLPRFSAEQVTGDHFGSC